MSINQIIERLKKSVHQSFNKINGNKIKLIKPTKKTSNCPKHSFYTVFAM